MCECVCVEALTQPDISACGEACPSMFVYGKLSNIDVNAQERGCVVT